MDYREFISQWFESLKKARFQNLHLINSSEIIDVHSMDRTYKTYLRWIEKPETRLFTVTAEISWVWDALLAARFATSEEDMLMQIHGDFGEYEETEPPLLRIDLILHASISLERRFPLPILAKWQRWVEKVNLELEPILPGGMRDGSVDMLAFRDVPEAVITFGSEGQIFLKQVSLKAW